MSAMTLVIQDKTKLVPHYWNARYVRNDMISSNHFDFDDVKAYK